MWVVIVVAAAAAAVFGRERRGGGSGEKGKTKEERERRAKRVGKEREREINSSAPPMGDISPVCSLATCTLAVTDRRKTGGGERHLSLSPCLPPFPSCSISDGSPSTHEADWSPSVESASDSLSLFFSYSSTCPRGSIPFCCVRSKNLVKH